MGGNMAIAPTLAPTITPTVELTGSCNCSCCPIRAKTPKPSVDSVVRQVSTDSVFGIEARPAQPVKMKRTFSFWRASPSTVAVKTAAQRALEKK